MDVVLHGALGITALALLCAAGWLMWQWYGLGRRVELAESRLSTLAAAYEDAERLANARLRFRRRQQAVEGALASGTSGLENAHRSLAGRLGSRYRGQSFYQRVQRLNRGIGRGLSAIMAPKARRRSESLDEWKQRAEQTEAASSAERPPSSE